MTVLVGVMSGTSLDGVTRPASSSVTR
ncbi:MAG: hypothetical protein RLZZ467_560, partial [Gemmatimonadota bacterium]